MKTVIAGLPRTRLVEEDETYLHYEFTSLLTVRRRCKFLFDDEAKAIHFRQISNRYGTWA
jgi:uncharacterized protein (DUF1499 family)